MTADPVPPPPWAAGTPPRQVVRYARMPRGRRRTTRQTNAAARTPKGELDLAADSPSQFMAMLRRMREWSGRTAGQIALYGQLPRSTAYRFVSPKNCTLPISADQVEAFALGCRLDPDQVTRVLQIWSRLSGTTDVYDQRAAVDISRPQRQQTLGQMIAPSSPPHNAKAEAHIGTNQDRSLALCRYRVSVEMPTPDDYLYDETTALFELQMTSPNLPRVGDELVFDVLDGLDLTLTVTGVTHIFRHASNGPTETETNVVARVQPHKVTVAQRLLVNPELLIQWAEQLPAVAVVPIPALVDAAALYRKRHPESRRGTNVMRHHN